MRIRTAIFISFLLLGFAGCTRRDFGSETRDQTRQSETDRQIERDSAARKAGSAAYKLAEETKAAAKKAARELREAGHEAREGWNEAKHDDQGKPKK